jgi:hypothetical protein
MKSTPSPSINLLCRQQDKRERERERMGVTVAAAAVQQQRQRPNDYKSGAVEYPCRDIKTTHFKIKPTNARVFALAFSAWILI